MSNYYDPFAFLHTDRCCTILHVCDLKLTTLMTGNGSRETSKKIHTDFTTVQLLSTVVTQKAISHKSFPIGSLSFPQQGKILLPSNPSLTHLLSLCLQTTDSFSQVKCFLLRLALVIIPDPTVCLKNNQLYGMICWLIMLFVFFLS